MYKGYYCRIEYATSLIKGKWKPTIIFRVKDGFRRYNAIFESIGDISHKVLVDKLRELEEDDIVMKNKLGKQHFEYSLTKKGEEMFEILVSMKEWVLRNEE